jgi:hypothetical protein
MDWTMVQQFIDARLMIVVVACWTVGYMLKKTPKVPNWSIIYIVTLLSLSLAVGLLGWSSETVIQGLLSGAFAIYGHQFVKQMPPVSGLGREQDDQR